MKIKHNFGKNIGTMCAFAFVAMVFLQHPATAFATPASDTAAINTAISNIETVGGTGTVNLSSLGTSGNVILVGSITIPAGVNDDITFVGGNITGDGTNPIFKITGTKSVKLDFTGVTIDGAGTGSSGSQGIVNTGSGALTVTGGTIKNCYAAFNIGSGAIYNSGDISVTGVKFINNSSDGSSISANACGGAIGTGDKASTNIITVEGCDFNNNKSNNSDGQGGAIFGGNIKLIGKCNFFQNSSGSDGGAISTDGTITICDSSGTAASASTASTAIVGKDIKFDMNQCGLKGGAITCKGNVNVIGAKFASNFAGPSYNSEGGAICMDGGGGILDASYAMFDSNMASGIGGNGGAIYADTSGTITFDNADFGTSGSNMANSDGGAIYATSIVAGISAKSATFQAGTAGKNGGAIYNDSPNNIDITSANFINNAATNGSGGAIYNASGGSISINGAHFNNNKATSGDGGAIWGDPTLVSGDTNTSFSANKAQYGYRWDANSNTVIAPFAETYWKTGSYSNDAGSTYSPDKSTPALGLAYTNPYNNYDISFSRSTSTVTFYTGNGNGSALVGTVVSTQYVAEGDPIKSPDSITKPSVPSLRGYKFLNWNPDITATTVFAASGTNDIVGVWAKLPIYNVTFTDDTSTILVEPVISGETVQTVPPSPTKSGYTFDGWYESVAGITYKVSADILAIPVNSNTTYKAVFKLIPPKPDNGKSRNISESVVYTPEKVTKDPAAKPVNPRTIVVISSGMLITDQRIKYINGYVDGSVRSNSDVTRAEVAQMFFTLTADSMKNAEVSGKYDDVDNNMWYAQAINYLSEKGILSGYGDGTFKPYQKITRAEFAKVVAKFDQLNEGKDNVFIDVDQNFWAAKYINSDYSKGWINGYPSGEFKPNTNLTRAEAVTIINNMIGRTPQPISDSSPKFNDLDNSHWAYLQVIEAASGITK